LGVRLRRAWYRRRLERCGANLTIEAGVHLAGAQFIAFGDDCWIDRNAVLIAGPMDASATVARRGRADIPAGRIAIGSRCHLGIGTIIQGHGGVRIGDDFTTSAGCKLYSVSNDVRGCRNGTVRARSAPTQHSYIAYPVEIGSNVWLGLDVKVIGHTIGSDVFVQAGSVVSRDLADNVIAAGAPAAVQSVRFEDRK
jgi:acetyltransferase-like isoleucine patch superfamily enzyme